jgi:hypothetical protein
LKFDISAFNNENIPALSKKRAVTNKIAKLGYL